MSLVDLEASAIVKELSVANPAAGSDWTVTVPVGQCWKLETLFFVLTTSAVVANRVSHLQLTDASNNVIWEGANAGLAASGSYRQVYMRLGPFTTNTGAGNTNTLTSPDVWLPAGYKIQTSTLNKDVGDTYTLINGLIRVSTADYS